MVLSTTEPWGPGLWGAAKTSSILHHVMDIAKFLSTLLEQQLVNLMVDSGTKASSN